MTWKTREKEDQCSSRYSKTDKSGLEWNGPPY